MKLESDGQPAILDPQMSQVQHAVSSLALPEPSFLILSRARMEYVQVAIIASDRFRIECREGSRQPVMSAGKDLSRDEVAQVLEAYRQGDDAWRREIEWQPADSAREPDLWDRVSLFFAIAGIALMAVFGVASRGFSRDTAFGDDPFLLFSIAFLIFLHSAIIDARKFRTMDFKEKTRTVVVLGIAVLIALDWIDRATSGREGG